VRFPRLALTIAALGSIVACGDNGPPKPSSVEIVAGASQNGIAGQSPTVTPSFVVQDRRGRTMGGVPVEIRVTAGDGLLTNVPSVTRADGSTPVGEWKLGPRVGANELTISVPGVAPVVVRATAGPGAPAKLIATGSLSITGRAGDAAPPLTVRLTDSFDNPIPSSMVRLALSGGGLAPDAVYTDLQGSVTINGWTLTTVAGQNVLTLSAGSATLSFIADVRPGDPDKIETVSGAGQSGRAGAPVESPIVLRVSDRYGNATEGVPMQFAVTSGNGTLASSTATPSAEGLVTVPAWTLGRTALPQTVRASVGTVGADVTVTVLTDYNIGVRFYGPELTDAQKALFTNAAARLSAIITGDVPDIPAVPVNLYDYCGIPGLPVYSDPLDDVVIYAAITDIDGPGKVLARAGPCAFRSDTYGGFAAFGVMEFDAADLASMMERGTLQEVISHEMLHVLGIGTAWQTNGLLRGARTSTSTYTGLQGRQGCLGSGGDSFCATGVPVENNGVVGTADSHWRESTFQTELMTGYSSAGGMPLSMITVGALADLGYMVNPLAADPYRLPASATFTRMEGDVVEWEKGMPKAPRRLP
jgi:hypothetical protein